jgi:hypothetical protein
MSFDLESIEDQFRIPHPDAVSNENLADVFFVTRPLTRRENLKLYNANKKKSGDVGEGFIDELFQKILISWEGITRDGKPVECTQAEKQSMCRKPGMSALIDYIVEETQRQSRDQLGIEEKN